jgi:dnd system-associated protein 4
MPRIRIETDFHEFYRVLAGDDEELGRRKTFGTMKDAFMLAFGFGVARGQRLPLGKSTEIFSDATLRPVDWDLIRAACLAEGEDRLPLIGDDDQLIGVAEEYANAGVRVLKQEYLSSEPEQSVASALLQIYAETRKA